MKNIFSIRGSIKAGWNAFKERSWFIIGALLIVVFAALVTALAIDQFSGLLFTVANIADFAFQTLMAMGLMFIMLAIYDKRDVKYSEWFTPVGLFFKYFAVTILATLAVLGGFLLFIIPGFIAMAGLMFTTYLVIDKSMGPIEAIKKSWSMSKGHKWRLLLFIGTITLFNIVGALAFIVGLLITVPVSLLATIHVYRILLKADE